MSLLLASLVSSASAAESCPVCGAGAVIFYEWQCDTTSAKNGHWVLVEVGEAWHGECDGAGTLLWGVRSPCASSYRDIGGGGKDEGQCWYEVESVCPMPDPAKCETVAPNDEPVIDEVIDYGRPVDPAAGGAPGEVKP